MLSQNALKTAEATASVTLTKCQEDRSDLSWPHTAQEMNVCYNRRAEELLTPHCMRQYNELLRTIDNCRHTHTHLASKALLSAFTQTHAGDLSSPVQPQVSDTALDYFSSFSQMSALPSN